MQRIAVVGNAGSGKSTLSLRLAGLLGIEVMHIDLLQWRPGWNSTPHEEFTRIHNALLHRERWIVDGLGAWPTVLARIDAADTVIFPDLPLWLSYIWAYKRQVRYALQPRPDLPENCPMLPKTWVLAKVIWTVHTRVSPQLLDLLRSCLGRKRIVYLRSPREIQAFLAEVEREQQPIVPV
jgi:adenylate kinase family enzyme